MRPLVLAGSLALVACTQAVRPVPAIGFACPGLGPTSLLPVSEMRTPSDSSEFRVIVGDSAASAGPIRAADVDLRADTAGVALSVPAGQRTSADGQAVLFARPGTYALRVRAIGYRPATATVQVKPRERVTLHVLLQRDVVC
jgi:hypothetical protein